MSAFFLRAAATAALALGAAYGCAAGSDDDTAAPGCPVGSETCPCTSGGACDPGLACLSDICVDPDGSGGGATGGQGSGGDGIGGIGSGGGGNCETGCQKVDVIFALDGSGSMTEEISALSATQSFTAVADALAAINCGDISYRIGVTDDNDGGFKIPPGWGNPQQPWFDSEVMTQEQVATAFAGAAQTIAAGSGTALGCEHVLSSAVGLLLTDTTGFVREDALLVLILVTDVDDYGAYDNVAGNSCGLGCSVTGQTPDALYSSLVSLKGGDPAGVATVVVAGDPTVAAGQNFCGQPCSCAGGADCGVYHGTKLWAFANLHAGENGLTANLCGGAQIVPTAVTTAFQDNIDLACQGFEPPK